ncbi:hypothetical protein PTKU64_58490 [Paraburkholderia terrae]|uniref:Uncharacterized protein n=1 Tax=Paraburkholderia terrae TaxID=311230 RepID=A0ABN6JMK0_9BURK|nr:hypothetical protein PTKU64_58490 [Paraburkholderia terrae]
MTQTPTITAAAAEPPVIDTRAASGLLRVNHNCEWLERAQHFRILIDAADYFSTLRKAMSRARHTIHIVGWDIDSRLQLVPGGAPDRLPAGLAYFLCALAENNRHLRIYILAWDFAMLYAFERECPCTRWAGARIGASGSGRMDGIPSERRIIRRSS